MELLRNNSRLGSLIILSSVVYTRRYLYTMPSVCHIVAILDEWIKFKIEVSADLVCCIEHQRLSSIGVIFIDY